jgi:brefeldin A-inhibited guanine nucleotide-exchange protein
MFQRLSTQNLLTLVECLLKSHAMAQNLSANSAAQRNLVWKATFKGRAKPNLQKMEAHSIHCALNIIFQLYAQTTEPEMLPIFKEKLQRFLKKFN